MAIARIPGLRAEGAHGAQKLQSLAGDAAQLGQGVLKLHKTMTWGKGCWASCSTLLSLGVQLGAWVERVRGLTQFVSWIGGLEVRGIFLFGFKRGGGTNQPMGVG